MNDRSPWWSRRQFVSRLSLAGTAGLFGVRPDRAGAEPPPETKTIALARTTSLCHAPQYIAEALLKGEGFSSVRYVTDPGGLETRSLASGEAEMAMTFAGPLLIRLDAGDPIVLLAGGHIGCLELFGSDRVRSVRDLKGKTVVVYALGSAPHVFLASIMAHVGLDHRKDIHVVTHPPEEAARTFAAGKADAFIASPPVAQELRARKIGHVVVNSTTDRPWSQYFCCIVAAHREFVRKYPVATKRALRAILKSADLCAVEPDRVARTLVERGFANRQDYARQAMTEIPYAKWREYEPEDTVRFFALRLHEAGMIKSSPKKLIAEGTDWRFLNELKRELKG